MSECHVTSVAVWFTPRATPCAQPGAPCGKPPPPPRACWLQPARCRRLTRCRCRPHCCCCCSRPPPRSGRRRSRADTPGTGRRQSPQSCCSRTCRAGSRRGRERTPCPSGPQPRSRWGTPPPLGHLPRRRRRPQSARQKTSPGAGPTTTTPAGEAAAAAAPRVGAAGLFGQAHRLLASPRAHAAPGGQAEMQRWRAGREAAGAAACCRRSRCEAAEVPTARAAAAAAPCRLAAPTALMPGVAPRCRDDSPRHAMRGACGHPSEETCPSELQHRRGRPGRPSTQGPMPGPVCCSRWAPGAGQAAEEEQPGAAVAAAAHAVRPPR